MPAFPIPQDVVAVLGALTTAQPFIFSSFLNESAYCAIQFPLSYYKLRFEDAYVLHLVIDC